MASSLLPDDGRTQWQRMSEGDWYIADNPKMEADTWRGRQLTAEFGRIALEDLEAAREFLKGSSDRLAKAAICVCRCSWTSARTSTSAITRM